MSYLHQDWNQHIISKPSQNANKVATRSALRTGNFETVEKMHDDPLRKIAKETDVLEHKKVSYALAKAIVDARLAKKMTRIALANSINEPCKVVDDYETKKAIPDHKVLNKMSRVLGVTLNKNM
jgi:putative transcription factor